MALGAGYLRTAADSQRRQIARLEEAAPEVPVTLVPLLAHEVSTLASLRQVADHLGCRG